MDDRIFISDLELSSRIGITEAERARPQRLTVSLTLFPRRDFSALDDRIENTVDYAEVCAQVRSLAAQRPRNLIETLAEEIAQTLLSDFPLRAVEIELRKYILPETAFVAVKIRRDTA
jgi:7,8-dihydroneopterin aldolase/epimerase/oxygenase